MTAKRKTPARAKAPAARSAISAPTKAANDAMTPASAASLIKASLAPAPAPALLQVAEASVAPPQREPKSERAPKIAIGESAAAKLAPRPPISPISREERHRMIAKVAYSYAERAQFGSDPVTDWLAAEREIDSMLARVAC